MKPGTIRNKWLKSQNWNRRSFLSYSSKVISTCWIWETARELLRRTGHLWARVNPAHALYYSYTYFKPLTFHYYAHPTDCDNFESANPALVSVSWHKFTIAARTHTIILIPKYPSEYQAAQFPLLCASHRLRQLRVCGPCAGIGE